MKICSKCKLTKNLSSFYRNKAFKDGYSHYCKQCDNDRKTAALREKSKKLGKKQRTYTLDARKDLENGIKYCPRCKQKKSIDEFLQNRASSTGIDFHCKECKRELVDIYGLSKEERHSKYIDNKLLVRDKRLRRKFGITLDEYNTKLIEQDGKCAICGITSELNGKALSVDHSHVDGIVRGLLCNNCNIALGFIKEDINKAYNLVKYIEKYIKKDG